MTLTLSREALQEIYKRDNKLPKLIDIDVHDTKLKQKVKQQTIEDFYVALQIVFKNDDRIPNLDGPVANFEFVKFFPILLWFFSRQEDF